ncbi:TapY2 family type IVa secretion system protein [Shewanella avicenniae]|uniref:TapY2 family type IVa secretion system protein n=1 Tax=Shewanella avicenniae TaxID=2814294 RepID=A0ABX7QTD1_9GAMM|nr:TapY2 family type IVa secretion system protein [Shewanella avicenniae]QSX34741.1 TapY2 family type IVa secretion system protein [Shewanella avicenniae]
MKLLLTLAILMSCAVSQSAFAAAKVSYKCYLETTKGHEVAFYRWSDENIVSKVAGLSASKRKDNKGKTYYVKQAVECVPQSEEFSSKAAQKLDKKTLR